MTRHTTTRHSGYVIPAADPVITTVKRGTRKTTLSVADQIAHSPTYDSRGMVYVRDHPKSAKWLALQEQRAADRQHGRAAVELSYQGLQDGEAA